MALQSSGAISLTNIQNEFGGSSPTSLAEYYKNGSYVTNSVTDPNTIPTSGGISFSDFHGAIAYRPPAVINNFYALPSSITEGDSTTLFWSISDATSASISGIGTVNSSSGSVTVSPASSTTYTLSASSSGGSDSATASVTVSPPSQTFYVSSTTSNVSTSGLGMSSGDVLVINSGVWLSSNSTSTAALTVNTSNLTIINNGNIIGKGGTGGSPGSPGSAGGPAISVAASGVSITNNSYIAGGGGGGAGGKYWASPGAGGAGGAMPAG